MGLYERVRNMGECPYRLWPGGCRPVMAVGAQGLCPACDGRDLRRPFWGEDVGGGCVEPGGLFRGSVGIDPHARVVVRVFEGDPLSMQMTSAEGD